MSTVNLSDSINLTIDAVAGDGKLRSEIKARWKVCQEFYGKWTVAAKEDYAFALGDQWTEEDRQALKAQGRPCLTFNRIRPLINVISGYQRENSARIKVNPEGGEDKIFSEVMDKAITYIDKITDLSFVLGYQFDEGSIIGKSFIEGYKTFNRDPVFGELNFELCDPHEIWPDPNNRSYDLNKGQYLFKHRKYTRQQLIDLFPNKESVIKGLKDDSLDAEDNLDLAMVDGGTNDDYRNRPDPSTPPGSGSTEVETETQLDDDKKFLLKEYWRYKKVTKFFVVESSTGEPRKFDKKDEAEAFAVQQGSGIMVLERRVKEMWVADQCCGVILQDIKSTQLPDYEDFPFWRFLGDWAPNAEDELYRVQGVVRQLKDPQREKNKAKSQSLHILNTQANSGWVGDDDALADPDWVKLEQMGSKPGIVIKKKRGSELREILPKTINQGMLIREQQAEEEFKQISNINPDLLSLEDKSSVSGKAMQIRIRQGMIALARLFSNYRFTKKLVGNYILSMLPSLMDSKKLANIVGHQYLQQNNISEGTLSAYLHMIKDNKYDLLVAESDAQATLRYETLTELMELAKTGAQIPPDLFVDYMDMPNSQEVKQRVSQYQQQMMQAQEAAKGGAS